MILDRLEFKNINSYGNNLQVLEFDKEGALILVSGENGSGKCLSPDTEIDISIDDELVMKKLIKFMKKRQ